MAISMVVLGFDYGEERIGVAVAETLLPTCRPLTTVRAHAGIPDWPGIARLVREYAPQRLVVGLPTHMDGRSMPLTQLATRFSRQLAGRFLLPVDLHDERLTSWAADQEEEAGAGSGSGSGPGAKRRRWGPRDPEAASLILSSWLAQRGEVPSA
jgi:putative Holliday junction resolvase